MFRLPLLLKPELLPGLALELALLGLVHDQCDGNDAVGDKDAEVFTDHGVAGDLRAGLRGDDKHQVEEDDTQEIYTSGATNIFKYPELTSSEKASELLYTIEEKKELGTLLSSRMDEEGDRGIQVYIGNETTVDSMKDCSVVTATYEVEEGVYGKIGIVGPKRMDYEKVVSTLHSFMHQLDDIFKKDEKKDEA